MYLTFFDIFMMVKNKTRPFCTLATAVDVVVGADNKIRSVKLKQSDQTITHHSINLLYPLELAVTHQVRNKSKSNPTDNETSATEDQELDKVRSQAPAVAENTPSTSNKLDKDKPKRSAARACETKMARWCSQLQ